MRAIVTGMIATYPVGGVAWDYGQYALGLERMGWEVFYLEDTGGETYNPSRKAYSSDTTAGVAFLQKTLNEFSTTLGERWCFRTMNGESFGIKSCVIDKLVAEADLFLNISGGTLLRDEYMASRCKVLIETDPGWNHFVNYPRWDANPGWQGTHGFRAHDHFFTYAERMGAPDCSLPNMGIKWHPTRPPVVMDCWHPVGSGEDWTTVMTWNNFRKPVEYQGRLYGTKEMEFPKVEELPQHLQNLRFELAVGGSGAPIEHWRELGWNVIDSHSVSRSLGDYRDYIQQSRSEFSVAKNLYTATRSGWFSCRSVCYLAAGRPCVVQDTGFSDLIGTGNGLFAFNNLEEAMESINAVEAEYERHSRGAVETARKYFDSRVVLNDILEKIGLK